MRLLLITLLLLTIKSDSYIERWVVSDESKIVIRGSTNVNSYECILREYQLHEELVTDENDRGYEFSKGKISLDILTFDCGNEFINKDFYSTLNSEKFPVITLNLSNIFLKTEINGYGIFEVEISGKRKDDVIIDLEIYKTLNTLNLTGKKRFYMSNFGVNPPTRLFGMIQVNDIIEIEFNLVMAKVIT